MEAVWLSQQKQTQVWQPAATGEQSRILWDVPSIYFYKSVLYCTWNTDIEIGLFLLTVHFKVSCFSA